eukprot:TRINITY_DN4994_c0_g1_i1.p1 TRINITY_DN4994_c0_g1~~TRINITY_DN4994_c0_g1_i1.p1  ORF type:complete len:211 (+),score=47.09 TRINITY_DN4994_c0_g1_i1:58-690(+)
MSEAYSFSLTTFSPSGKLVQIEYALAAVGSAPTSLGIRAKNGVVLATEKKLPNPHVVASSIEKVSVLADHVGSVYSGMGTDYKVLVEHARKKAEAYHRLYNDPAPVKDVVKNVASLMQEYTQSGGVRPFGVSMLICGYDHTGPTLHQVDPSGSSFPWKATAIGKNMINAKTFLEKRYSPDMELDDAIHTRSEDTRLNSSHIPLSRMPSSA